MQCFITRWNTEKRVENVRRAAEYSWWTLRYCSIYWWNTVSNAWYYFSNKKILDREIKDVKMSSFSSDYQTLPIYFLAPATQAIDFNFLCIFFTNYRWVWEQGFNKALCSMTLCSFSNFICSNLDKPLGLEQMLASYIYLHHTSGIHTYRPNQYQIISQWKCIIFLTQIKLH